MRITTLLPQRFFFPKTSVASLVLRRQRFLFFAPDNIKTEHRRAL
jgi:hypothetical protein